MLAKGQENNLTENDEIILINCLENFYDKIIHMDDYFDFDTFEDALVKWVKNIFKSHYKNLDEFFKMMQNHENYQVWFSSFIGFLYQYGIGCDINKNAALELYLLIVNNKFIDKPLENNHGNQLNLVKVDRDEYDKLQNINITIGKYLLSLFYYKDMKIN